MLHNSFMGADIHILSNLSHMGVVCTCSFCWNTCTHTHTYIHIYIYIYELTLDFATTLSMSVTLFNYIEGRIYCVHVY